MEFWPDVMEGRDEAILLGMTLGREISYED